MSPSRPTELESDIARLRFQVQDKSNEVKRARRSEGKAWKQVESLERLVDNLSSIPSSMKVNPKWLKPKRRKPSGHTATPVLLLSDLHLDEVVRSEDTDGLNHYDRAEAEKRLSRVVTKTAEHLKVHHANVKIDGVVVALLGDIVTGEIHEELARTNEAPIADTIVHWVPRLAEAIKYLRDEMKCPVHVVCVSGNHDRNNKRPQYKNRATESLSWIIYKWMASILESESDITFSIAESPELQFSVYGTRFLAVHGDAVKGGGGIGGVYPAIARYVHKVTRSRVKVDYVLMGHWHQHLIGPNFVVNGSLKGYDEYARGHEFPFQRPEQALFVVTPERGIVSFTTVMGV